MVSEISLGLWHNFGAIDSFKTARSIVLEAYDSGITMFDLANNYGPPPGSAEATFGKILKRDLRAHRNQILVTSKAGYTMWPGPYGDWGSRKYLVASCDESLERLGLKYLDIFYSHRYDPKTPLEETMGALDYIVRSGRALYVGLSNYPAAQQQQAFEILRELGTPCIVDQLKYSLLVRKPEVEHFAQHRELGVGCVSFSPLAQGQLTDRYLGGVPVDSRAGKDSGYLQQAEVAQNIEKVQELQKVAESRGESLAKMALGWQLQGDERVSSIIIGASRVEQLHGNLQALDCQPFTSEQLAQIDKITL